MHPAFHDVFYQAWKSTPILKDLSLPTYFLIIFPLFTISIFIFGLLAKSQKINLHDPVTEVADGEKPSLGVPKWQKTASTSLFIIAGICLVADTVYSIIWQSSLVPILAEAGKETCEIRETPDTSVKFKAYFPSSLAYLCPDNGDWNDYGSIYPQIYKGRYLLSPVRN